MDDVEIRTGSNGIGIGTLLTIVFVVLKLTDHIDWSWWWVTAPLWAPPVAIIIIVGLVMLIFFTSGVFIGFVKILTGYVKKLFGYLFN